MNGCLSKLYKAALAISTDTWDSSSNVYTLSVSNRLIEDVRKLRTSAKIFSKTIVLN